MSYKNEVNSAVGDKGRMGKLCDMLDGDFNNLSVKYELLYNTICLMQEGIVRIEDEIQSLKNDLESISKENGSEE